MKKIIIAVCFSTFLSSCITYKLVPLTGSYPPTPITYITETPVAKVWDNIIDFFSQHGFAIKIIDRSSGLIVSDRTPLPYTFESKDGDMITPEAFTVLRKFKESGSSFYFKPVSVTGEWNIRIKTVEGKTSVNVNLTNIFATYETGYYAYTHVPYEPILVEGKTTGKFEKTIFEIVK